MTYEIRLNANYAFGALSQAAQMGDTTLSSNDFATKLPSGLSTTTYVPVTLHDPGSGTFEIVWANAHTAGATTATVLRGREGTTTALWPAGTLWTIAPTLRDAVLPVATRAVLPTDPHVGLECLIQDEQTIIERYQASWGPPGAVLRQTVSQTIPPMNYYGIGFQAEDYDNANGHDNAVNNHLYTFKQAGRYLIAGRISFNTGGQPTYRIAIWYKNNLPLPGSQVGGSVPAQTGSLLHISAATTVISCNVNDNLTLVAYQDSGGNLGTNVTQPEWQSHMMVQYVGPL